MAKTKTSKSKAALPSRAPKKTGKRGMSLREFPGDLTEQDVQRAAKEEGTTEVGAKKPRQPRLPTMEDPEIEELESKAEEYADIRDQRMELTPVETRLKNELLGLMEKHGKTSYVHDGYDIKVVVESKKIKVRVKKEE